MQTLADIETLPVKIDYVGETTRDEWKCDQWRVTLSSKAAAHSFDYFTGTGLRREVKGLGAMHIKTWKTVGNKWVTAVPVKPKVADVLHSLILDADAANENFDDWCDNFGYSSDSIKALNTYKACLDTARALRKHLSPDALRQARELLQDY